MRPRPIFKAFAVMLMLSAGACGLLEFLGLQEPSRKYSHKLHTGPEVEFVCENCHIGRREEGEIGRPSIRMCVNCHEGIDADKPEGEKLVGLIGEDPEWSHVTDIPDEVIFSHPNHFKNGLKCWDCHKGIRESEAITEEVHVAKDTCMSCHAEKGISNDCAYCHKEIRRDAPPPSHRRNWKQQHGGVVRAGFNSPVSNRCELCHSESSCTTCHQDEAPLNHNNFWRYQGHAVASSVDREGCQTCHQTDYCDRCHRETSPRTHVAGWGGTQSRHCLTCHVSRSAQNCSMCHSDAPSHSLASPQPAGHTPGMNCRQCHSPGLPEAPPHVDNGDNCNACHQ